MTTLVFKNRVSREKLNTIVHLLKVMNIDAEIKKMERRKIVKKDHFAEVRGIWADRDIDSTTLRKQAWGIEN